MSAITPPPCLITLHELDILTRDELAQAAAHADAHRLNDASTLRDGLHFLVETGILDIRAHQAACDRIDREGRRPRSRDFFPASAWLYAVGLLLALGAATWYALWTAVSPDCDDPGAARPVEECAPRAK